MDRRVVARGVQGPIYTRIWLSWAAALRKSVFPEDSGAASNDVGVA